MEKQLHFLVFRVGCVMSLSLRVSVIRCHRCMSHLGRPRPRLRITPLTQAAECFRFRLFFTPLNVSYFFVFDLMCPFWRSGDSARLAQTGCCCEEPESRWDGKSVRTLTLWSLKSFFGFSLFWVVCVLFAAATAFKTGSARGWERLQGLF